MLADGSTEKQEFIMLHKRGGRGDRNNYRTIANEKGDILVEWATSNNIKIMNTSFHKKPVRRWTWISLDGNTKNEVEYIVAHKRSIVTDVTIINRVNIGSDHRMVMGSVTLNT